MPIWLTILLALPQIIEFAKEIYALWKQWRSLPKDKRAVSEQDFRDTLQGMKNAKSTADKERLVQRLRDKINSHKCAQ